MQARYIYVTIILCICTSKLFVVYVAECCCNILPGHCPPVYPPYTFSYLLSMFSNIRLMLSSVQVSIATTSEVE